MTVHPVLSACALAAGLAAWAGVASANDTKTAKADARVQQLATDGEEVIELSVQRGQLTHVVLPAGESFVLPPATGQGARCDDETHAWCIAAQGRDLFIKAKPAARTNNLILVTERRRYAIELRAVDRGGLMRLSLLAPKSGPRTSRTATSAEDPPHDTRDPSAPNNLLTAASPAPSPRPDPQKLVQERLTSVPVPRNSAYSMAIGKVSDEIAPSMVFDDGRFTYFKFAGNRPLPAMFQPGADGEETVNVRMGEDDFLVADRIAPRFVLRLGQAVVVVVNDAYDIEGVPATDGTTVPGVARTLSQVAPPRSPSAPTPIPPSPARPVRTALPAATAAAATPPQLPPVADTVRADPKVEGQQTARSSTAGQP